MEVLNPSPILKDRTQLSPLSEPSFNVQSLFGSASPMSVRPSDRGRSPTEVINVVTRKGSVFMRGPALLNEPSFMHKLSQADPSPAAAGTS